MPAITQIHPKETNTASNSSIHNPIRFIRKREVMHMTGLPSSTLYDLMSKNLFPQKIKLSGGKAVAWLLSDVESWQAQCLADRPAANDEKGAA